jgi:hypothetical protein
MTSLSGLQLAMDQSPSFGLLYCRSKLIFVATASTRSKLAITPSGQLRGAPFGNPYITIFYYQSPLTFCQLKFLIFGFQALALGTLNFSPTLSVPRLTKLSPLSSRFLLISRIYLDGRQLSMAFALLKRFTGTCLPRTRSTCWLKGPEASCLLLTTFFRELGRPGTYHP